MILTIDTNQALCPNLLGIGNQGLTNVFCLTLMKE
jgi:hypothetical protein